MTLATVELGKLGEELVASIYNVSVNENFYDTEKDLVLPDGTKMEVKTQNRHPRGYFTIRSPYNTKGLNNVIKCFTVDHLVFVEYDASSKIKVWECTNRKNYVTFTTRDGRDMIGFPIHEMKCVKEIEDASLAQRMRSFSQSKLIGVGT